MNTTTSFGSQTSSQASMLATMQYGGSAASTKKHPMGVDARYLDRGTMNEVTFDRLVNGIRRLSVYKKLQQPDSLALVSRQEVVELFNILSPPRKLGGVHGNGELAPQEIGVDDLLILSAIPGTKLTEANIRQMAADCDRDGNGVISIDELFKAITQGSLAFDVVLREVRGDKNLVKAASSEECTRDQLVEYLRFQFTKNDACFSLPFTFVFFTCFLAWMGSHLEIRSTYELHAGIRNEIDGEGGRSNHEGPFLHRDVHDIPTFWDWFNSSFVAAAFRKNETDHLPPDFPIPGRVASFNQIIGGVGLQKTTVESAPCAQANALLPYYDNRGATAASVGLATDCQPLDGEEEDESSSEDQLGTTVTWFLYQEKNQEIRTRIQHLIEQVWLDTRTTKMTIKVLFYNAHYGMFTLTQLEFLWRRQGLYVIRYRLTSFLADPYYRWIMYVVDLVYGLLLAKMMYSESKELLPAMKNGVDGFMDYWGFWNAVDWLSILCGFVLLALWWHMSSLIGTDLREQIDRLPQVSGSLDQMIHSTAKGMYLTEAEILQGVSAGSFHTVTEKVSDVHEVADQVATQYELLRVFIGVYLLVIMLRFFKGFRANPRLEVVTRTIVDGSSDIAHFFVVFMTIFIAFMATAQALFGHRMRQFSDLASSLNTGFAILLGDFDFQELLGDGTRTLEFFTATVWFWFFQWSVTIIMFNILLAIVMNQFAKADAKQIGAETIIEQAFSTYQYMRETKGHLDIWYLLCEFEDDDDPAHPDKQVSARSLRRAFPRMSKNNSEYLVQAAVLHELSQLDKDEEVTLTMACRMITKTLAYAKRVSENLDLLLSDQRVGRGGAASRVGRAPPAGAGASRAAYRDSSFGAGGFQEYGARNFAKAAEEYGGEFPGVMSVVNQYVGNYQSFGAAEHEEMLARQYSHGIGGPTLLEDNYGGAGTAIHPPLPGGAVPGENLVENMNLVRGQTSKSLGREEPAHALVAGAGGPHKHDAAAASAEVRGLTDFLKDRFQWLDRRLAEGYADQERIDLKLNSMLREMQKQTELAEQKRSEHGRTAQSADWRRLRHVEDKVAQVGEQNARLLELVERLSLQLRQAQPRGY